MTVLRDLLTKNSEEQLCCEVKTLCNSFDLPLKKSVSVSTPTESTPVGQREYQRITAIVYLVVLENFSNGWH